MVPRMWLISAHQNPILVSLVVSAVSTHRRTFLMKGFASATSSFPFWDGILASEEICRVRYCSLRSLKKGTYLVQHSGAIWDMAASQGTTGAGVHPLVLSASSDGVCSVISSTNRIFGGSKVGMRFGSADCSAWLEPVSSGLRKRAKT
jgi:hypothetical protein